VDAEAIYVHPADDAWDNARIEADRAAMKERGEDPDQHPVWIYLTGRSRYDLHAKLKYGNGAAAASDWLDLKSATQFHLRRLDPRPFARVHARKEAAAASGVPDHEASLESCRHCLASVEGPGAPKLHGRGELTDRDIDELVSLGGHGLPWAIGDAGYFASIPLTDDEKKAFAF
jgi:hypothetical protein